jgi:nucleoside-diphosphate-sugar epimerase
MTASAPVVVLGGSGRLGSRFVDLLLEQCPERAVLNIDLRPHPRVRTISCDLIAPPQSPSSELAALGRFDLVSLAACITVEAGGQGQTQAEQLFATNVTGILRLAMDCRSHLNRIVHASSLEVYGPSDGSDFLEDRPLRPETAYGISKLLGEQGLRLLCTATGVSLVTLRFGSLFGPEEPLGNALSTFLGIAGRDGTIEVQGDGSGRRSYIHVDDAAHSLLAALAFDGSDVFNIANPELVTVRMLAEWAIEVQGRGRIAYVKPELRPVHRALDTRKMLGLLRYRPTMSTVEGMGRVLAATSPN